MSIGEKMSSARRAARRSHPAPHELYDQVADAAADVVIRSYSTSFGMASRLLAGDVRTHVRNVYALVRVADEIVDAPRPDGSTQDRAALLADLHEETLRAMETGHSANLVVHAFARSARTCGITRDLLDPFFASMEMDLHQVVHDDESFARYVHGSAEVIGLMCLRVFLLERPDPESDYHRLSQGALRLGAAFQKVNFLRDLAADFDDLGRSYFPGVDVNSFDRATLDRLLDDIDADMAVAADAIPHLPVSSRRAVRTAHSLFSELSELLRQCEPEEIRTSRIRVPSSRKVQLVALAFTGGIA